MCRIVSNPALFAKQLLFLTVSPICIDTGNVKVGLDYVVNFFFFFFFKYHRIEDVYVFSGNLLLELSNICWNLYIIYYVYIILYYIIYILELQIYYEKICKMFEVATSFNERDTFSFRFHFFNCP